MKRMSLLLAALTVMAFASGCGCCRCFAPAQTLAVAQPACPPPVACDPCATGTPVTYGMPGSTYMPAPQW